MAQTLSAFTDEPVEPAQSHGRWEAELRLGYRHNGHKTVLSECHHRGPLAVQRALYPEGDVCHSHLLHPPGGVVGGDCLTVAIDVKEEAQTLVTTPGAARFYRSGGRVATLNQSLTVGENSRLEWLPLENIAFPNAHLKTRTDIQLSSRSQFVGWEIWTLGQPASHQDFDNGVIDGLTTVSVDSQLILCERLRVNPSTLTHAEAALRGFPVISCLFAYGDAERLSALLKNWWAEREKTQSLALGITDIDGLLAVRALAQDTEVMFQIMSECWLQIRRHWTGKNPDVPRIWRT